jgi:hypothetical protein
MNGTNVGLLLASIVFGMVLALVAAGCTPPSCSPYCVDGNHDGDPGSTHEQLG